MQKRLFAPVLLSASILVGVPTSFLTISSQVRAQQEDATTKAARERFKEGVGHFDKGRFEDARTAFLQAYALKKHPSILLNLAQSSVRSGHNVEAAKFFQQYLREAPGITDTQRKDAERGLKEARAKLGRVSVSAPSATEISVDSQVVGVAPLTDSLDLEPGTHSIRAKMSDGSTDTKSITVRAGELADMSFAPASVPLSPSPRPDPVVKPTEPPPVTDSHVPPATTEAPFASDPPASGSSHGLFAPPKSMAPFWIGLGVAALGTGGAIYFSVQKSTAADNAALVDKQIRDNGGTKGTCVSTDPATQKKFGEACGVLKENLDAVDNNALVGNISLGVAIAGAGFAIGWYLFGAKKEDGPQASAKIRVLPTFDQTSGRGLTVVGSF